MIYYLAFVLLGCSSIFMMAQGVRRKLNLAWASEPIVGLNALSLNNVAMFLFIAPVILVALGGLSDDSPLRSFTGTSRLGVALITVASVLMLCIAVTEYRELRMTIFPNLWKAAYVALLIGTSLFGLMVASHHFAFTRAETRMVNLDQVRAEVRDIDCDSAVIAVNWAPGSRLPAEYRCPTQGVLYQDGDQPFIPWPNYSSGMSRDLSAVLLKQSTISAPTNVTR